jgi:electron transfer flavoprotein beta subunit
MGKIDIIIAGRQAIDGDTAQVGPQVAEKLGIPQITYAEDVISAEKGKIVVKRRLERGVETVEGKLPMVVTVNASAPECRPRNAKFVMKYKHARAVSEMQNADEDYIALHNNRPYLNIGEWSVNDIETNAEELGLTGSPTKVKSIENVVFQAKEAKVLEPTDEDMGELMRELIANHTIG